MPTNDLLASLAVLGVIFALSMLALGRLRRRLWRSWVGDMYRRRMLGFRASSAFRHSDEKNDPSRSDRAIFRVSVAKLSARKVSERRTAVDELTYLLTQVSISEIRQLVNKLLEVLPDQRRNLDLQMRMALLLYQALRSLNTASAKTAAHTNGQPAFAYERLLDMPSGRRIAASSWLAIGALFAAWLLLSPSGVSTHLGFFIVACAAAVIVSVTALAVDAIMQDQAKDNHSATFPNDALRIELYKLLSGPRVSVNELQHWCTLMSINWEDLPGDARSKKANELVTYCSRRNQLMRLQDIVRQDRPDLFPSS